MPDQTKPDLEALAAKWARILRLLDWDIQIRYARNWELKTGQAGHVSWNVYKKAAVILVLDPVDYNPAFLPAGDVELTVVHEVLHLQFAPVDNNEGLSEKLFEQSIHAVSRALLALDRGEVVACQSAVQTADAVMTAIRFGHPLVQVIKQLSS